MYTKITFYCSLDTRIYISVCCYLYECIWLHFLSIEELTNYSCTKHWKAFYLNAFSFVARLHNVGLLLYTFIIILPFNLVHLWFFPVSHRNLRKRWVDYWGGQRVCWLPLSHYWGGLPPPPPPAPPSSYAYDKGNLLLQQWHFSRNFIKHSNHEFFTMKTWWINIGSVLFQPCIDESTLIQCCFNLTLMNQYWFSVVCIDELILIRCCFNLILMNKHLFSVVSTLNWWINIYSVLFQPCIDESTLIQCCFNLTLMNQYLFSVVCIYELTLIQCCFNLILMNKHLFSVVSTLNWWINIYSVLFQPCILITEIRWKEE